MFYYLVWVRSNRYHGSEALTYSSDQRLKSGAIVEVELQNEQVLGFVVGLTSRPRFKTKNIIRNLDLPEIPNTLLNLSLWLQSYYPAPIGVLTQLFLPPTISDKAILETTGVDATSIDRTSLPTLTNDQSAAVEEINDSGGYLLRGVTGSGKTRIYIEKAIETMENNRSALMLTPEISLTSQLEKHFKAVFSDSVLTIHSQQTAKKRLLIWLQILKSKNPMVIIGPRSALFSPIRNLGLIVLDESHETAYKQEQSPHYQTGRVASYLAGISRATVIYGSATPSLADYYLAEQKHRPIITLDQLAKTNRQTRKDILVVDRKDKDLYTKSHQISNPLLAAVETALQNKQQSLLYLNRRGTARLVMCENCGWQAICPHCDLPLTYHGDSHTLRCHSCNYHTGIINQCPVCSFPNVLYKTAGTKAIVEEVNRLFPYARVARFDTDNTKMERFEQQYEAIYSGKFDIIIGTQLLAKGLDLPNLRTLGVLLADTSLYLPDFSSQERTYQLLSQILGRIGRGHIDGQAIIQTYHPKHPIIKAAIANDYQSFYKTELATREQYLFPPFCYIMKLSVRRSTSAAAAKAAEALKEALLHNGLKVLVEGPSPSFYERFQKKYQWQLVVKSLHRNELLKLIKLIPSGWSYDIDPLDLL